MYLCSQRNFFVSIQTNKYSTILYSHVSFCTDAEALFAEIDIALKAQYVIFRQ